MMMDFMSHFTESILCNAMSSSPGFRGDRAEFPSPAMGGNRGKGDRTGASAKSWSYQLWVNTNEVPSCFLGWGTGDWMKWLQVFTTFLELPCLSPQCTGLCTQKAGKAHQPRTNYIST